MIKQAIRLVVDWYKRRKVLRNISPKGGIYARFYGNHIPTITIGDGTYANFLRIFSWKSASAIHLNIGKYCSLAQDITIICGGEHDTNWVSSYPFIDRFSLSEHKELMRPRFKGNIDIGNDVWIGQNVTILSGVSIGDGAVVGAGAVVSKDIPPYAIAVGVPAKVIKYRFPKQDIEKLLKIKWWDWPQNVILSRIEDFTDISKFIAKYTSNSI